MIGHFLAILSGLGFAGSSVYIRQAVFRTKESGTSVFISIIFGAVVFSLVLVISGNTGQLTTSSWRAIAALVGAGIIHFTIGRWLTYYGLQLIGANRSSPLRGSSTLVSVILGITLIDEPITWSLALGVCFILMGVVLVSTETGGNDFSDGTTTRRNIIKGVSASLLGGICYGTTPVLVKIAINEGTSPYTGIFISYSTALLITLFHRIIFHKIGEAIVFYRKAIVPMSIGVASISMAQLCRYVALDYIPVSIVSPLNSTASLFTIVLSFIINRKIELFTWKIIVGAILVVSGVFLIFQV
jgi:drug/metabolite transporter (DMT)-like permease